MSDLTIVATIGQGADKKDYSAKRSEVFDANGIKFTPGASSNIQDISKFIFQLPDLIDCLDVCVASKELKENLKTQTCIKRSLKLGTVDSVVFYIFFNFQKSDCVTAMSFGRFIAMCSGSILLRTQGEYYSIKEKKYIKTLDGKTLTKEIAPSNYMNRLAEKQGIPSSSRLYWLYLPGMENLVSLYPAEVIAICAYRAINADKVKLAGSPVDSLRSVAGRMRALGIGLNDSGLSEMIVKYYGELLNFTHNTPSMIAAAELFEKITDLVKSVKPSDSSS